jgi:ribosomal protein L12E/L44/L45/RPP1/RPP2
MANLNAQESSNFIGMLQSLHMGEPSAAPSSEPWRAGQTGKVSATEEEEKDKDEEDEEEDSYV